MDNEKMAICTTAHNTGGEELQEVGWLLAESTADAHPVNALFCAVNHVVFVLYLQSSLHCYGLVQDP